MEPDRSKLWKGILGAALGTLAVYALAIIPAAASDTGTSKELTTIKIGIYPGNTSSSTWVIADQKGFFAREGLKAKFVNFANGPALAAAVVSGSVDVAYGASAVSFDVARQSSKLVVLGDFAEYINWYIVAAKDKATSSVDAGFPTNVKSLKGLKIGVAGLGGVANKFVLAVLESAGVSADDVTMIAVGAQNTAIPALKNGRVDALAAIASPQDLQQQGVDSVLVVDAGRKGNAGPNATDAVGIFDTSSRDFMEKDPATLNKYCKAMIKTVAWEKDPANFDEVSQIVAKQINLPVPLAAEQMKHDLVSYTSDVSEAVWKAQPAWITGTGNIPSYKDTVFASCGR
jgi:NitT/TauT family transport system substrate-binding protein